MKLFAWLDRRPALQCASLALILNLIVESLSRHSLLAGLGFLVTEPVVFLYNSAIIMLTLSLAPAVKRRYFALGIISMLWLALGVTNCILLSLRTTPFGIIDIQLLESVSNVIAMYINFREAILIAVGTIVVGTGLAYAWIKTPKRKPSLVTAVTMLVAVVIFLAVSTSFLIKAEAISSQFGNLADAYRDYGFAYCFSLGLVDRGISKPEYYSPEVIAGILDELAPHDVTVPQRKPNIIMVQLESFFDVNYLKNLRFSENPVPVFSRLKEEYPHGFLRVPSLGAGTANTEFEILSGLSLAYFGAGEYPYKTVLRENTTPSIPFDLKELGYTCHAIHNHTGTFYGRHIVFANLGFDTFTSREYMNDVEFTPVGWAKDKVLTGEIMKALKHTPGADFVFAISVQAHGRFPSEALDPNQRITVEGLESEKEKNAFEYFVNQIYETDAFIGALLDELAVWDEPVILVLYGDHLPSLDIAEEDLRKGGLFDMEYVLWSNFPLEAGYQDLHAYQLGAYVLEQAGISTGILTKLHQTWRHRDDYQTALEMLAYDMVCGEQYAFGGESPYVSSQLRMGITEIVITDVRRTSDTVYVVGDGFTPWSQVYCDGKAVETTFINPRILKVAAEDVEPGASLAVAQVIGRDVLSTTIPVKAP